MKTLGGQGSVQWLMDRTGKVTASNFGKVRGTPAKRDGYLFEHVCERLTGQPTDHYISKPMMDGIEREPFARMKYEAATGAIVEEVGFVPHPDLPLVGGSPDGLIGSDGIIECKCPTAPTHIRTLLDGMSGDHLPQVQGVLWITGRKWCDFISYYPDLPPPLDLHIQRIERDDNYIAALAEDVAKFLADAETLLARLKPTANESAPQEEPREILGEAAPPAAADPADDFRDPLIIKAREWAECGTEKYASFWTNLTPEQRKHIGTARHESFKKIAAEAA